MTLLANMREKNMRPRVEMEKEFYNRMDENKIIDYQLETFNKLWKDIQSNVLYYNELINIDEIPRDITNFDDFSKLPIVDREFANKNMDKLIDTSQEPDSWVTTGGST